MKRGRRSSSPAGRRRFLGALGATLAAPAILHGRARPKRFPLAFSTLGCPAWSLARVLDEAARLGFAAVELRGLTSVQPARSTIHIATMNPTVPQTRIGGNLRMTLKPCCSSTL